MGAAFLITLREGLEIAIVLAILVGYLVRTERREHLRSVWLGAAIAVGLCLMAGFLVHSFTSGLEGDAELAVEGTLALSAALVLTYMILWMHRNARTMGGHLRSRVEGAQSAGALMAVAFVGVAREGFETVLFLLGADTGSASGAQVVLGGLLGLMVSAVAGVLLYAGSSRIDLRKFFRYTGLVLILFAAGLAAKAIHEFRILLAIQHGWLVQPMWSITSGPLATGTLHDFLRGLLGWSPSPERLRVAAYFAYAIPVLWLFLRPVRSGTDAPTGGPAVPADSVATG